MILSFKTKFSNDKPTYFIQKIWASLPDNMGIMKLDYEDAYTEKMGCLWDGWLSNFLPKRHTIREDKKNRWHTGVKIHFTVFNRSKNMFRFAPIIECKSTQTIDIFQNGVVILVTVDGKLLDFSQLETLAVNDGFDNTEKFLNHFFPTFKGKIIHWTDLKY